MKFRGGYAPHISGKPSSSVDEPACPPELRLSLVRNGAWYEAVVSDKQSVNVGDILAKGTAAAEGLILASPASGKVSIEAGGENEPAVIIIREIAEVPKSPPFGKFEPARISEEELRNILIDGGLWQYFWSSKTGGVPSIDGTEKPKAVIISCVIAEPFRARGKVILSRSWPKIAQGIRFLPRLLADYGSVAIALTSSSDPVARAIYKELSGDAWVKIYSIPVKYPVEEPIVLSRALRESDERIEREDTIWTIDLQGIEAIGNRLAEGMPNLNRVIAVGGPAEKNPRHVSARIGTPIKNLVASDIDPEKVLVLRGGLMRGTPVDLAKDTLGYDDDAIFCLPKSQSRELLGFVWPGLNRTSIFPCFLSKFLGRPDSDMENTLRGELRACVACGACEDICPVDLMPQILHRYLYRNALDEVEAAGLTRCIECGLCAFVCTSKIDLSREFKEAKAVLAAEKAEVIRMQKAEKERTEKERAEREKAEKEKSAEVEKPKGDKA